MRKINIVLLTDCLGNITGGAEKQIFELSKRLPKDQYNVFVASMEAQGSTSRPLIESIGCRLEIFRVVRIYGLSGLIQGLRFRSFLVKNSIDVLVTYHFASDIWGTFWGHLAGVGQIISNRRDMGFWRNQSHVLFYRMLNPWVKRIVAVTSSIKQMVISKEGVAPDKIVVIYNGVEFSRKSVDADQLRAQLNLSVQDVVIMHVANLRPVKGHVHLIHGFAQIAKQYPKVKLVLIGKDELEGTLQAQVQQLQIESQVLFLGQRNDVSQLLSLAHIAVLPSLSEGMSNAILEYMSFGLPVIATRVGGNPELIIDGHNGLLVPSQNPDQLAQSLKTLIDDEPMRRTMGANGLASIKKNFSMEQMLGRYEALVQEKMEIRVLHLVSSGGLFGAEQVMLTLSDCHDGMTHVIGALNNRHNPHLEIIEEAQKRGIKTAVFESKGRFDLSTISQITDYVRNNNINIIHTHNYKSNLIGAWAARQCRVKWVATVHGWIGTDAKLRGYEKLDMFILRFANRVVCVSEPNYQSLLQQGFSLQKLGVVSNGIELTRFSRGADNTQLKQALGINKETVIAIVGRLAPEKGHRVLLEAMARVVKSFGHVKLLIVGDGPLKETLEDQIKNLNLSEYIVLTGIRKDMPAIYGICDILVNASFTEGLPMTILEAMAAQVAVIATKVGGVGKVIRNQENGIIIDPGNAEKLAEAILILIKDESRRRQLVQRAYTDVCENFSDGQMSNQYRHIYNHL